jgi:hypothetical protein
MAGIIPGMNKCICSSKAHGHGDEPCGRPAAEDFCDDCTAKMVADKAAGSEALDRQTAETTGQRGRDRHRG